MPTEPSTATDASPASSVPRLAASDADVHGALLAVLRSTASQRDLGELLGDVAALLRTAHASNRLALVLHDSARDVMRLHLVAGFRTPNATVAELPVAATPSGAAWATQRPIVVPRLDAETRFPVVTGIYRDEGMRSLCVVPLTSPLRRLGALSFASAEEDAFGARDVALLECIAGNVALAVDNTLHHEAAERAQAQLAHERDRLRLLLDLNNALVSTLEPRALFRAVATAVRRVVTHEYTSLAVWEPERRAFDMWALEFAGKGLVTEHMSVPLADAPAGIAFAAGRPTRFGRDDLRAMRSEIAQLLVAEGVESMCCVPLTVHERRLGTLNVGRLGGAPFSDEETELLAAVATQVAFAVENALAFQEIAALKDKLSAEKVYLEDEIRTRYDFEEIVGESPRLKTVLHQVETVAPTDSAVLIRGETGTGKELVARALHDLSRRRARTFVKVNCAAIPSGLLESELFGHERGAFTGAIATRVGRFELADGGTLFLDEVGDIALDLQPKLLRVLQEREFERLGSSRTRRVDVRVVAATNRDLEAMVAAGTFRSDLYYRLNVFPIAVPALRERSEDVPALVRYFVQKLARQMNKRIETIPSASMAALVRYAWPGNVRELENAVERAVILTEGSVLRVPASAFPARVDAVPAPAGAVGVPTLAATEREAILRALQATGWVLGGPHGAAARLGMKRTTLQSRMQKLGIRRDET